MEDGVRTRLRVAVFHLLTLMVVFAEAAPVNLAGRTIEIPIPAEYCQFGKRFIDVQLARMLLGELGNDNQVLAFFADCKELDAYRHGEKPALDNFGLIFAQKRPGGGPLVIAGRSREAFLKDMGGMPVADVASVIKSAEAKYALAQARGKLSLQSEQPFRLQVDSNGAYFGIFGQLSDGRGQQSMVMGVLGITLVKELFLSIEIYRRFSAALPVEDLLERQSAAMEKLVTANQ